MASFAQNDNHPDYVYHYTILNAQFTATAAYITCIYAHRKIIFENADAIFSNSFCILKGKIHPRIIYHH